MTFFCAYCCDTSELTFLESTPEFPNFLTGMRKVVSPTPEEQRCFPLISMQFPKPLKSRMSQYLIAVVVYFLLFGQVTWNRYCTTEMLTYSSKHNIATFSNTTQYALRYC